MVKITDWILESERSEFPLTHRDLRDLRLICPEKKRQIRFGILSDFGPLVFYISFNFPNVTRRLCTRNRNRNRLYYKKKHITKCWLKMTSNEIARSCIKWFIQLKDYNQTVILSRWRNNNNSIYLYHKENIYTAGRIRCPEILTPTKFIALRDNMYF